MADIDGIKVLFSDNFSTDGFLDKDKWGINKADYKDGGKYNPAFLGDITLMRQELPKAESGVAHLRLDTWNYDWKNGKSFYGSEAISNGAWDAQSTQGVAFEGRFKFDGTQGGMIAGMFFYEKFFFPPGPDHPRKPHNELDWEVLSSQLATNWKRKISTNVFPHMGDTKNEQDFPKSLEVTKIPGFTPNDWHNYRVEWLPNKVVFRIDGEIVRVEKVHVPQADVAQQLHLNIWGVPTFWGPSAGDPGGPSIGDSTLVPATSEAANKTYWFDIDKVKVEQLSTRIGTNVADRLVGSKMGDGIDGLGGADNLKGEDGGDTIWGGSGDDTIAGGGGSDTLDGEDGNDLLFGGAGGDSIMGGPGQDTIGYRGVADSDSRGYDTLVGFNCAGDNLQLPTKVTGIDPTIASGRLSDGNFNRDLAAAANAATLLAYHAVVFTPSTGNLAGQTFLLVDANGVAGYQAREDYVMRLDNPNNLASLSTNRFTT